SAFFVNDIICLVLVPFVLTVTRRMRVPALPYLLAVATASNIGSVATITGNPQNMLIGSFSHIGYRDFLFHLGPIAGVGLLIDWGLLVFFIGLFLIVGGAENAGLTNHLLIFATHWNLQHAFSFTVVTAALSNLLSNVPAVMLLKSLIPGFADPHTAWLILAMASTLSGNLTITGSVANIIVVERARPEVADRKSTRLNSSHV